MAKGQEGKNPSQDMLIRQWWRAVDVTTLCDTTQQETRTNEANNVIYSNPRNNQPSVYIQVNSVRNNLMIISPNPSNAFCP